MIRRVWISSVMLAVLLTASPALGHIVMLDTSDEASGAEPEKPVTVLKVGMANDDRIVCMDIKRTGTRLSKRRCQTVAAWKSELETEYMRRFLLDL